MRNRPKLSWPTILTSIWVGCFCCMALAQQQSPRIAVFKPTTDQHSQARILAMLSDAFGPPAMLDLRDDWSAYSLLVLVASPVPAAKHGSELTFTQKLATFYFRGGHVLVVGVPGPGKVSQPADSEIWDKLMNYFWGTGLRAADRALEDPDRRALFVPNVEFLEPLPRFRETVQKVVAARDELPAQLAAEDFGPVPSVALRENSLWIDHRPQLLKAVGYEVLLSGSPMSEQEAALQKFHALGFNAVTAIMRHNVSANELRQFLDLARQNSIYVQLQIQSPVRSAEPLRKEYLLKALRLRHHPALIGWIVCDDTRDVYFPFVEQAVSIIRRYDDRRLPVTTTFLDTRQPQRVHDWAKWTRLVDFPLDYVYPMQKDPTTNIGRFDIEGGLKDIDRLMANTRKLWPDVFAEQFLQAHIQGHFAEQVGLEESLIPGAGQERLIASRALLSGVKGLIFFHPSSLQDEGLGRSRADELAILWRELSVIEDILAAGAAPESLSTSDKTVDASLIRSGNEAVVIAVRDQPHYNRYIDNAQVQSLTIQLIGNFPDCPAFQLGWPEAQKLDVSHAGGARSLTLHPFALSTVLVSSCNDTRQRSAQEMMKTNLPVVARYAIDILDDENIKTVTVRRRLPRDLQGEPGLLDDIAKSLSDARKAADATDWATAWQKAREGLASVEAYRAQAMRAAVADADRRAASPQARVYLNIYFALPNYAYVTRGGSMVQPDQLRKEVLEAEGLPVW